MRPCLALAFFVLALAAPFGTALPFLSVSRAEPPRHADASSLNTFLAAAVRDGNVARATRLLAQGADPNYHFPNPTIVLTSEATGLPPEKLKKPDGSPLTLEMTGWNTLLGEATAATDPKIAREMTRLLLRRGAKVNNADDQGWTALLSTTDLQTLKLLLGAGADPNLANHECDYPISVVPLRVRRSDGRATVRLLRHAGARLDVRDKKGHTPIEIARMSGRADLLRAMQEPLPR